MEIDPLPPPSLQSAFPAACHGADWGQAGPTQLLPSTLRTALYQAKVNPPFLRWRAQHIPTRPHWPAVLGNQNSGTSSGHLFSGNFSAPYQHLTALTSLTERRLIKMTKLTLIYYHTAENNKQLRHCCVWLSLSTPPCISHTCFATEAKGKRWPQSRELSLCFLPSQVSSPPHRLSIPPPTKI